ncbi:hypothetical protein [Mycobacterium sp. GA-1841]|nr:hypothetical protein [Mycobacterium sp. GA-1841]
MTTSQVVFDPFSEDFFNGPYETYRRMRVAGWAHVPVRVLR